MKIAAKNVEGGLFSNVFNALNILEKTTSVTDNHFFRPQNVGYSFRESPRKSSKRCFVSFFTKVTSQCKTTMCLVFAIINTLI